MTFPEQLKTHRERLGLTQAELASFLDVSPRAVWQWEKGTLPHVLTQEGALARLSKANRRTQGTNVKGMAPGSAVPDSESTNPADR